MHYFFSVPLVQIVADQLTYATYLMRKPDMDYRQDIVQTAIADIRISMHAFEDVWHSPKPVDTFHSAV